MAAISEAKGRIIYDSRGGRTIEVDIVSGNGSRGRACAPAGASVGRHEAVGFPDGGPEASLDALGRIAPRLVGTDAGDLGAVHEILKNADGTTNWSGIGGALAFAVTIAAAESAANASGTPLFDAIGSAKPPYRFPFPLGNILGGGAHAGPGTPDIQEILVCPVGAKGIEEAVATNLEVHRELRRVIEAEDPQFTNGRGDEGGWAPIADNRKALDLAARACENLGFALGKEVALGVDFASSTQWDGTKYAYGRAGFENTPGEQIEFAAEIIKTYKLAYAEDAVHEEAFGDMAELVKKFPGTLITGDDLTVTNAGILARAADAGACNAAILKVNQAGSLYDAMGFASEASRRGIGLVTSHRSGETSDSQISHIGIATGSKMLKVGVVGGERVAKLNELLRLSGHNLICGMAGL